MVWLFFGCLVAVGSSRNLLLSPITICWKVNLNVMHKQHKKSTFRGDDSLHTSVFLGSFNKSVKCHFKVHLLFICIFLVFFFLFLIWQTLDFRKLWNYDVMCLVHQQITPLHHPSPSVYPKHLECCQRQLLIKPGVLDSWMVYFGKHEHFQQIWWFSLIMSHITWKLIVFNFPCIFSIYKCLSLYNKRTCVKSLCH